MHLVKAHRTIVIARGLAIILGASLLIGIGQVERYSVVPEVDRDEEVDQDEPAGDYPAEARKLRSLQLQDEHGQIPLDGLQKAKQHVEAMKAARQQRLKTQSKTAAQQRPEPEAAGIQPNSWSWLGPGNVGGRIRSMVINPANPNSMWVGSVSGGIWHTANAGASWQPVNDFMANLAVSTMVMDPKNTNILYAGTGEGLWHPREEGGINDGVRGLGVFKSTDGGVTWNQLPRTNPADPGVCAAAGVNCPWSYVNRLAISPDGSTLLAATTNGLWRSTDGGANWITTLSGIPFFDTDFDPANSQKAIASGTGAFYSTDGGQTFNRAFFADLGGPVIDLGRVETAYAASNPSIIYASVDRNGGEVFRSTNGGQSFILINTGTNFFGNGKFSQGDYDNIIWVNPLDSTNVIVGGINLWESFDGGQSFLQISMWQCGPGNPGNPCNGLSAHADQHMIVSHPGFNNTTNRIVYFTNDGGVFRTDDVRTVYLTQGWVNLNNSLGITQFYGGAGNPLTGVIVGGAQDNGSVRFRSGPQNWNTWVGGDGGFCAADPRDSSVLNSHFYGETDFARVFRSTDGGVTGSYIFCDKIDSDRNCIGSGITEAGKTDSANFIAPLTLDPNNPDTLLVGGLSLWRSRDVRTAAVPTWEAIKSPVSFGVIHRISVPLSTITVHPNTSSFILVGDNIGRIFLTLQGDSDAATVRNSWKQISAGLPARFVLSLAIDNTKSPSWIYATFGGFTPDNVYRSTDLGKTWNAVTGSGVTALPSVPVRSLVIHPRNPNLLYVGTEIGIFTSEDAGATWDVVQEGPANVSVDQLFWMGDRFGVYGGDELVAVTHGRGMYAASGGIYVDASYAGPEVGTFSQPFMTLRRALDAAAGNYRPIWIKAGTYNEKLTITTPVELRGRGGTAVIGKQP